MCFKGLALSFRKRIKDTVQYGDVETDVNSANNISGVSQLRPVMIGSVHCCSSYTYHRFHIFFTSVVIVLSTLLFTSQQDGTTALILAAHNGDVEGMMLILQHCKVLIDGC